MIVLIGGSKVKNIYTWVLHHIDGPTVEDGKYSDENQYWTNVQD